MKIRQIVRLLVCILVSGGAFTHAALGQAPPAASAQPGDSTVPLPERNPLRAAPLTPEVEAPPHPRERQATEWTAQDIQAALDACGMMLDQTATVYRAINPIREGVCGTAAPVEVSSIGANPKVAIDPPARMTCGMAASLGTWSDTVLQPAAKKHIGTEITAIRNVASYVCRNRYNAANTRVSEHARANALDMAAFKTTEGEWITVLDNWSRELAPATGDPASGGPAAPPPPQLSPAIPSNGQESGEADIPKLSPEATFLQELHSGGCALFGTVLGPEANDAHKDHFHFDLAARDHSNFCE